MGNTHAGKHFKESEPSTPSSRAVGSQGARRGGKMQGIEVGDITYRITYRSPLDEVIATCAYSESGVVEG